MKRLLCLAGVALMSFMMVVLLMCSVAYAEDVHHTITFYSGADGQFSDGTSVHTVEYGVPVTETTVCYSHTPNVGDDGVATGNYSNNYTLNDIVTIAGAESVHVAITFAGEARYDYVCMWSGAHSGYTANEHYGSSITGKLGGGVHIDASNTKEYDVIGDTVTFAFYSDSSSCGNDGYGYYAVVTGQHPISEDLNSSYEAPVALSETYRFKCWNTMSDGSGIDYRSPDAIDTDMNLYAMYEENYLFQGTYRNVHWHITHDKELVIGRPNEEQTFTYTNGQSESGWPWYNRENYIESFRVDGTVYGSGNMDYMFYYQDKIKTMDFTGFDVSGVTSMVDMFYRCSVETLNLSSWDTSNVTNMSRMFCMGQVSGNSFSSKLKSLNLSGWDVSHVTSMHEMFCGCQKLEILDVSEWDTSSVTDMGYMFYDLYKATEIKGVADFDTHLVTDMECMFCNCNVLPSVDVSNWDVSQVKKMNNLFNGCLQLIPIGVEGWDTRSAMTMTGMFLNCRAITSLDLSGWDVSHVTKMAYMFEQCYSLVDLDISGWNTPVLTDVSEMFSYCRDVTAGTGLTTLDLSDLDTDAVTTMKQMFRGCEYLEDLNIDGWNTGCVETMAYMFQDCKALPSVDVSGFDTSNVTSMAFMFDGCESLTELNVLNWDVSQVIDMISLFDTCMALQTLNLSTWRTSSLEDMHCMFADCQNLESLEISNFDTSHVTAANGMFTDCKKLKQIDVSGWDTTAMREIYCIFMGCSSLEKLDLSSWDLSACTHMNTEMFSGCRNLAEVVLGDHNPFNGDEEHAYNNNVSYAHTLLPSPPSEKDGIQYTRNWIKDDLTAGPYTSYQLANNYVGSMAGTWVWEKVPTEYSITFVCIEDGYVGEMPSVTVEASENYELPRNAFKVFGYDFDHWTDGTRRIYLDREVIPANTYAVGAEVMLTAIFEPRDRSINMQDGSFDFSIKADEKALFSPIPASTSYQVYEQTPFGWNLIKQVGNTGVIAPITESEALFLNKYDPLKATVRFVGTKLMDDSVAGAETFSFLLYEDDTLIDIATVGEAGVIEFQPITYDRAGNHNYTIQEVIGNDRTVEYDTHVEAITVAVESDGVGHLSVDIHMDDDEIVFENRSKPGLLALRKAGVSNTDEMRDGTFYYEVQFVTQNGQPYELASSEISYEEREGEIVDLPEAQPLPEKPKYTLTVEYIAIGENLAETVKQSVEYQYCAGDVVTINGADTSAWTSGRLYYAPGEVDSIAVRVSDGVYKFIMPAQNLTVQLKYDLYKSIGIKAYWIGVDYMRPDLTMDVFADGDYIKSVITHEEDPTVSNSEIVYTDVRYYDDNGRVIEYTMALATVPDDYYLEQQAVSYDVWRFYMHAGYRAHIIWDDFDNAYGTRPSSMRVTYTDCAGSSWQSFVSEPLWRKDLESDGENYREHDFNLQITTMPSGYEVITSADDDELGKYDKKLKLVARPVSGSVIWDDNNDANGVRPENITVKLMNGENVVSTQNVSVVSEWQFNFTNLPVTDETGLINYTVAVDDMEGYTKSVDGTTITLTKIRTVNIPITDVTLLSASEYNTYRSRIPSISKYWWLRGPGSWWSSTQYVPSNVMPDGSVEIFYASDAGWGIRPVLVCNLSETDLSVGDKIHLVGYDWTVISDSLILCDQCVGNSAFGPGNTWPKSQSETLTTPYDDSYAKTWVENWATTKDIMPTRDFEILEVTLLGRSDYETYRNNIPSVDFDWWLRDSPYTNYGMINMAYVSGDENGMLRNVRVDATSYHLRPVLVCDLSSFGLSIGDKVSLSGHSWTMISSSLILCDDSVATSPFRTDKTADDVFDYAASDAKACLDSWVATHPLWVKTAVADVVE